MLLPDELLPDGGQTLSRMIEVAEATGESVISLVQVEGPEISNYGCAASASARATSSRSTGLSRSPPLRTLRRIFGSRAGMSSRPTSSKNSSALRREGGEIQLTDAMAMQIDDRGMRGLVVDDAGFDAGQKADWLRANVELSLRGDDGADVAAMLRAAGVERLLV